MDNWLEDYLEENYPELHERMTKPFDIDEWNAQFQNVRYDEELGSHYPKDNSFDAVNEFVALEATDTAAGYVCLGLAGELDKANKRIAHLEHTIRQLNDDLRNYRQTD